MPIVFSDLSASLQIGNALLDRVGGLVGVRGVGGIGCVACEMGLVELGRSLDGLLIE